MTDAADGARAAHRSLRRTAAFVLVLLAHMTACSSRQDVLTVAVALLPGELAEYRRILMDFEKQSNVRVVVVPQQYADIRRALAAEAFAGRGTLDLVELDVYALALAGPHVAVFGAADLGHDLDAFAPLSLQAGRIDGIRFLPQRVAWQALIYNREVLGKPPDTWAELLAVARAHPGRIGLKGALYEGLTCDVLPFVWAAGGSGERFDDAGARRALELFAALAPYLHPQSATFKEATIAEAMARGEIVLHLNWPFVMSLYASHGLAPGVIRSAPLPQAANGGRATVLGGGYIAIPRSAPHRTAAVRLARYLLSQPVQQQFARELGWFSARRDVEVDDSQGLLTGFVAMRDVVRPRPDRSDYPRLSRLWQQAFRDVAFGGVQPSAALTAAAVQTSGDPHAAHR